MAARQYTGKPVSEALPELLRERGWSIRRLAREVEVSDSHLSRALRRRDYKAVSGRLAERIAVSLGLPPDYFPEARLAYIVERVEADVGLRDRLYEELRDTSSVRRT